MKKVCIYSGSFNPIHNGHIALAESVIQQNLSEEVWVVVSPHNPMKVDSELLDDALRLEMAKMAFGENEKILVSDIEFRLPRPSYTIDTLEFIKYRYKECQFSLLIGGDNLQSFSQWRRYKDILLNYEILVYPRGQIEVVVPDELAAGNIKIIDAPKIDISSTEIRYMILNGVDYSSYLPPSVVDFIMEKGLYC